MRERTIPIYRLGPRCRSNVQEGEEGRDERKKGVRKEVRYRNENGRKVSFRPAHRLKYTDTILLWSDFAVISYFFLDPSFDPHVRIIPT